MLIVVAASYSAQTNALAADESSCNLTPLEKQPTYQKYYALCHGKRGEGNGKSAPLYRRMHAELPSDFTLGFFRARPLPYLISMIKRGGKANNRGRFMPLYGDELNDKEIEKLARVIQGIGIACDEPMINTGFNVTISAETPV